MKKWSWYILASAAVVAVAVVIYWKAETCEARANKCISSLMASGKYNQAAPPNEAIQACRESQGYFCRILAPANIPNLGLFFVGAGAVLAALGTLKILTRQAVSMRYQTTHLRNSVIQARRAAKATKISADALVASQRAWLDGEFQVPPGTQDTWGTWILVAKNHGATPAQLIRHECSMHMEGVEFSWETFVQKHERNWGILVGAGEKTEPLQMIKPDDFFRFLRERGDAVSASCTIGVRLIYLDVINPKVEHETKFLMLYLRPHKSVERLSKYTEYN